MQTLEYRTIDKSGWTDGPWHAEPDKKQFTDEATGLPCLIVRNGAGNLCGYVGVSEGHPLFQLDYDAAYGYDVDVDVHGGLTYANFCVEVGDIEHRICHLVEPGENDRVWWLGFDTSHAGDLAPAYQHHFDATYRLRDYETYKDLAYVEAQCAHLAAQLAAMH